MSERPAIMQVVDKLDILIAINAGLAPLVTSNKWDSGSLHTPATDRSLVTSRHQLGLTGTLTSLKIRLESGVPQRNVYVEVTIEDNQQRVQSKVFQGFVDIGSEPFGNGDLPIKKDWFVAINSWSSMGTAPTLTLRGTIEEGKIETGGWDSTKENRTGGIGNLRSITGTNPATGVETEEAVPTNALWKPIVFKATVVGGAAAFDPRLQMRDASNNQYYNRRYPQVGAAATRVLNLGANVQEEAVAYTSQAYDADGGSFFPMPSTLLPAVFSWISSGITADDDYQAPRIIVEEYLVE